MKKGFTLIEMMIVISILGTIMMTGLYPGFSLLRDAEKRSSLSDYTENMMNLVRLVEVDLQKGGKTTVSADHRLRINLEGEEAVEYVSLGSQILGEPPMICRSSSRAEKKCFTGLSFQSAVFSNRFFRIDYVLHFGSERNFVLTEVHPYVR